MAVDLYDGCVLYDFSTRTVKLIDLDHYRRSPYLLDVESSARLVELYGS
ncbi:MAG TPA: hypothetical protein VMZ33_06900 [Candidatus Limnocylindrales bacterium]|nr:hypothetical protein [Candidatus Limnocylindrales bacterium]